VPFNTGTSTNTFPVTSPVTPGSGMIWDLSKLWVNGSIGIISSSVHPNLTNSFSIQGTNVIGQFSWDPSYFGYRLETQTDPISVGVTATNWAGVPGSWTNLTESITNTVGTNCVFYRLVFP
jgi:hypothetical protein